MGERRLVVGYESALDFWRAVRVAAAERDVLEPTGKTYGARPLTLSERAKLAINLCNTKAPLDVVVKAKGKRRGYASIDDHVWRGPITDEHLRGIGNGIYVCRMPVVFCQLATKMDEIGLAEVACEMAGTYGLAPWTEEGSVGDLEALVGLAELEGYAGALRALGVRGGARAAAALDISAPGSNSPRETGVAIFFKLSRARGGADLGGFSMNKRIELPPGLAKRLNKEAVIPDFSWDNGTVVEYDSTQEHLSPEARARDEAKRRAYKAEGLDCLTLTNGILRSNALLNLFVEDLEDSLGIERRPMSDRMEERRAQLRERLFGSETREAALAALNHAGEGRT